MKLEELYVHICKHTLIHSFYITLLCMHDTATYNIVAINSNVSKCLNPTLNISQPSSVGYALDL